MKINLTQLQNGKSDRIEFDKNYNVDSEEQFETAGIKDATPIHIAGKVARVGSEIMLDVQMTSLLNYRCSRCLEDVKIEWEHQFTKLLYEGDTDDLDSVPYEGYLLDLEKVIIEELNVNLPLQVLCDEDCKGLCPVCGINLNHKTCDCEKEKIDPRFEVLDDFFS